MAHQLSLITIIVEHIQLRQKNLTYTHTHIGARVIYIHVRYLFYYRARARKSPQNSALKDHFSKFLTYYL